MATAETFDASLFKYDAGYYQFLPGYWLPGKLVPGGLFTFSQKGVDSAVSVEVEDTDFLVATFPKTGQTWTMAILGLILQAKDLEAGKDINSTTYFLTKMPFMETEWIDGDTGGDKFRQLTPPRVMKTHLPIAPYQGLLKKYPNIKVIQVIRNPKDTLVSLYHHLQSETQLGGFTGTWDQFFDQLFKQKKTFTGDLFQNTVEWYNFNKDRANSLIIKYEDLKRDHRGHVIKLAKFLGYDLSDAVVDLITQKTSKKDMNKDFKALMTKDTPWDSKNDFVRKGIVGDWVNYFSKEQSDYVDAQSKKYFEPLGITFEHSQ